MARSEITYNKVVNVDEDGEITVLADTFRYDDGFKGATGHKFIPVSKEEYDEKLADDDAIVDYLSDKEAIFWDFSYRELWEMMRTETGLSEDEAYVFNCVGGGRCFDKDYQGNVNPELSEFIREAETKQVN